VWTARTRRGGLGLRGRIVGAVLVTTVATLAIAALALLGPLEQELRNKALATLKTEVGKKEIKPFEQVQPELLPTPPELLPSPAAGARAQQYYTRQQAALASKIGVLPSLVTLLGYPSVADQGYVITTAFPHQVAVPLGDTFDDATKVFGSGHLVSSFGTIDGTQYARLAVPVRITVDGVARRFVLAVRKPIDDIPIAVKVVRKAFFYAALAGLGLTLVLGIPLAATLVRRLRRLRQAALQLALDGPPVEVPDDRARDEAGDLARAFAIMQRRLAQQEEARRAFVATASHELRTPLTSLEGMLELLDEGLHDAHPDLPDARALLERARVQSRRLGRLAADLLDLSRMDAEVELRSEPVELGELSRAVMAEFELGSAERSLTLVLDDDGGPVWARGDPGSVARILRILLENAVRVSDAGSEIRVAVRNGANARLTVCDKGPGVPAEERELIFERFKRGRDTGGQAGFGLGLAIGRELAQRMSGALTLEHQDAPGAQFTLTLPVTRAPRLDVLVVS
jgi:signal transduction histidine kinase